VIRALNIALWFTVAGCALPARALAPKVDLIEPFAFSPEPFRLNPRFCFGSLGSACERQPIPL